MKKFVNISIMLITVLLLLSCSLLNPFANTPEGGAVEESSPISTEGMSPLAAEVTTAREGWEGTGIASYHIQVQDVSFWYLRIYDIYVEEGAVAASSVSCLPSPIEYHDCSTPDFDAEDYTVPGLFEAARQAALLDTSENQVEITFDASYLYPASIHTDSTTATDSLHTLSVILFEPDTYVGAPVDAGKQYLQHWEVGSRLPQGSLNDMRAIPGGSFWLALDSGLYTYENGYWLLRSSSGVGSILGSDNAGRVWFLPSSGGMVMVYDPAALNWAMYTTSEGWSDAQGFLYHPAGNSDRPVSTADGKAWLALGDAFLRVFDPQQGNFKVMTVAEVGYDPAQEDQLVWLTDVALMPDGSPIVSHCSAVGELYGGQGLRVFGGGAWKNVPETGDTCLTDIEVGPDGTVWAAGMDGIFYLRPGNTVWAKEDLPPWERRQMVSGLDIDAQGERWANIDRQGGASFSGSALAYTRQGEWAVDLDTSFMNVSLGFDRQDGVWLARGSEIMRMQSGSTWQSLDTLDAVFTKLVVDDSGIIWILARQGSDEGLWVLNP